MQHRPYLVFGLASLTTAFLGAAACGSSGTTTGAGGGKSTGTGPSSGTETSTATGTGSGGGGGDPFIDSGPGCNEGDPCGDGGICAGGLCCDANLACAAVCCAAGQVCSFQQCETPGSDCVDPTDCPQGFYCDYALGPGPIAGDGGIGGGMCMGGKAVQTGKCLSKPPQCADGQDPGDPITCLPKCEYKPMTNDFSVVMKMAWGGQTAPPTATDVMMAPIVVQLDDDNCDGKVNQNDIPEIVFSTFTGGAYYKQGSLHAISAIGGKLVDKWTMPNVVQPGGGLAAADLDGDGVPEIVGCANPGPAGAACCDALAQNTGAVAFKADGSTFWSQLDTTKVHCGYEAPVIGDLDQDGIPEVVIGWTILDGKTGAVKKELDPMSTYGAKIVGLSDVDGDGKLDITDGQRAYRADGTVIWDLRTGPDAIPVGYHAVGDLDKDGKPEVVIISSSGPHTASVIHYNAASPTGVDVIRKGIDINNGTSTATYCKTNKEYGGGPPTVADFDGDGFPDVGAAGAVGYVVMSGQKLMDPMTPNAGVQLWFQTTHDCSSAVTGSSVFDFNGDGKAEVIYSDEYHLWMYDGPTGANLIPSTCNTTGTLWEYPLVADVDNDGEADIVVASNAYGITCPDDNSKQSGIRVFGSASGSWVRTRRIWNEHTYHITNIGEDGKVPAVEPTNWTQPGLNDYRQNRQPGSEFGAPDAVVSIAPACGGGSYSLVATVRNLGEASLPAGVVVGFYEAMPMPGGTKLGQATTTKVLYPAEAEKVTLDLPMAPPEVLSGAVKVYAIVDDTMTPHLWHECRTDNDTSEQVSGKCDGPK
jgi:FG-GAP-like repeat